MFSKEKKIKIKNFKQELNMLSAFHGNIVQYRLKEVICKHYNCCNVNQRQTYLKKNKR